MSDENAAYKPDSIESAMSRIADSARGSSAAADASAAGTRSVGRREYDQALSRRFDQIRTALGTDESPQAAPLGPTVAPAPAVQIRVVGISAIVLTALVSALVGAGFMWLALGGADHPRLAAPVPMAAAVQTAPAGVAMTAPATTLATTPAPVDSGKVQARDLVERWRAAWAGRDVDAYLGFYSAAFVPADGSTRSAWVVARRKNILGRSDISVRLNDVQITRIGADQAKVVFLQDYASGAHRETAKMKTLLLTRVGDDWRIAGEWMGERPEPALVRGQ